MQLNRGDIVNLDVPGVGRHPVVVVSRQESLPVRTDVTVALITSSIRGLPAEVPVDRQDGLDHPSVVNCDQLWTVPQREVSNRIGSLRYEKLRRVDSALEMALGLRG